MVDPLTSVVSLLQPKMSFTKIVTGAGRWGVRGQLDEAAEGLDRAGVGEVVEREDALEEDARVWVGQGVEERRGGVAVFSVLGDP